MSIYKDGGVRKSMTFSGTAADDDMRFDGPDIGQARQIRQNRRFDANRILDKSSTDSIVDGYSTIDVGVSVMNEDGLRSR